MRHRRILVAITGLAGVMAFLITGNASAQRAEATAAAVSTAVVDSTPLPEAFAELLRSTTLPRSARHVRWSNRVLGPVSIRAPALHPGRSHRASRSATSAECPVPSAPCWERGETSTTPSASEIGTRPSDSLAGSIAGTLASTRTPVPVWPTVKAGCTATGTATTPATLPGTITTTVAGAATGLMDIMAGTAGASAALVSASAWALAWEPLVMALVVLAMVWVVLGMAGTAGMAATAAGAIPAMVMAAMDLRDQVSEWEEAAGD